MIHKVQHEPVIPAAQRGRAPSPQPLFHGNSQIHKPAQVIFCQQKGDNAQNKSGACLPFKESQECHHLSTGVLLKVEAEL